MSIEDAAKEKWDLIALPGGMPGTLDSVYLEIHPESILSHP